MFDTLYVKPKEGGRIRQPDRNGDVMPDGGARVPRNGYYERLLISQDIVEAEPPELGDDRTETKPALPAPAATPSSED